MNPNRYRLQRQARASTHKHIHNHHLAYAVHTIMGKSNNEVDKVPDVPTDDDVGECCVLRVVGEESVGRAPCSLWTGKDGAG